MPRSIYENSLADLSELLVQASEAEVITWRGRKALRLVDGLALVPDLEVSDVSIEVQIGVKGSAYPGVAFRVSDVLNYELAYAVPHCSGLWDAVQYDPIFQGSNTWQLYHGPPYQKEATVPTGEWFGLKVDVKDGQAVFTVGDQPPLVVGRLAHPAKKGFVGIWAFRPAYFCGLRVSTCEELPEYELHDPVAPQGVISDWFLEGFGTVKCEPSGILNLNRYLPLSVGEVRLTRQFQALSGEDLELALGFSDELSLQLDDEVIFTGKNTFVGFGNYQERGYAYPKMRSISRPVTRGTHRLTAILKVTEGFGWGMVLSVKGGDVRLLPARLG
jgi:hypothetical protein